MDANSDPAPGGQPALITPHKSNVKNRSVASSIQNRTPTSSLDDLTTTPSRAGLSTNKEDNHSQNLTGHIVNVNTSNNKNPIMTHDNIVVSNKFSLDDIPEQFVNYCQAHPLIGRIHTLLFNEDFHLLYEYAKELNSISPDLIELNNIEFGVKFQQIVFYGRDRTEYDLIYEKTNEIDRQKLPSICVRTRRKDSSSDVLTTTITKIMRLQTR